MKRFFIIFAAVLIAMGAMAQETAKVIETTAIPQGMAQAPKPSSAPMIIMMILIFVVGMALLCGCIYLTYKMAKNRYRDPVLWILLAFVTSPIIAWIALLIAGEDELRKKQYEDLERERSNNNDI